MESSERNSTAHFTFRFNLSLHFRFDFRLWFQSFKALIILVSYTLYPLAFYLYID